MAQKHDKTVSVLDNTSQAEDGAARHTVVFKQPHRFKVLDVQVCLTGDSLSYLLVAAAATQRETEIPQD